MLRVETIDNSIEDLIITGMIIDTPFLQKISRAALPEYFETDVSKILVRWIREYFFTNKNTAPQEELMDIFQLNEQDLDADESKTVRTFLKKINKEYEGREFNSEYVIPKALRYLEGNAYRYKIKLIERELKKGEVEKAKDIFNGTSKEIFDQVTTWKSLSDNELLNSWWGEIKYPAMRFSGALGQYMPNIERGRFYAMFGPAKRGKCISGDSLIHLADGRLIPLKQVVEEKIKDVFCKDDDNKIIPGEVIDWMYSGVKQGYLLTTKSRRSTEIAKDHKFYTPSGWKKLEELKVGDLVSVCKNIDSEEGENIQPEELQLIAYLIADGHLKHNISFTKLDKEIMNDFVRCVDFFGDKYSVTSKVSKIFLNGDIDTLLQNIGLRGKLSGDKFIPDYIMQSSKESLRIFLKTLFTCDGSIYKERNNIAVEYSSKSKLLIQQICSCLYKFGIFSKLKCKKVNKVNYYSLSFASGRNVKKYMEEIGFIGHKQRKGLNYCSDLIAKRDYLDIIPAEFVKEFGDDQRKKGIGFNNWTFNERFNNNKNTSRTNFEDMAGKDHPYLNNDILWDRIISIEKTAMIPMYDLEVKDNHNYLADNFIVHNSFWLLEWAYQGAFDGLNTVVFSLEMNATELDQRWKEKITGKSIMNKKVDTFNIPVLDCIHNQKNKCQIPECKSPGTCVFTGNLRDSWVDHPEHKPCTHCKGLDDNLFVPSYWMIQEKIPRLSLKEAKDTQRQLDEHIGENRVRIISFPITSATVADLEKALEELALHEKFIADLIVIDYADILKEDVKLGEKRHRVGDNWQQLSRMAKTRNAIVVTASQGNRGSAKKNRLDVDDVAEDFSKIMTIDGIFAINEVNFDQADKWQIDHNWQVQRIETIALRYGKFVPGLQCVTFNDLARGQIYMDGFIKWR